MKLNQTALAEIVKQAGASVPAAVPGLGTGKPDDMIARINDTITNFKSLVLMVRQEQAKQAAAQPPTGGLDLAGLGDLLIKQGFGDTSVGKLLENIAPMTLNQLKGVIKNGPEPDG